MDRQTEAHLSNSQRSLVKTVKKDMDSSTRVPSVSAPWTDPLSSVHGAETQWLTQKPEVAEQQFGLCFPAAVLVPAHPCSCLTAFSCGRLLKAREAALDGAERGASRQRWTDDTAGPSDPAGLLSGSPDSE
ncbi:unnamed protein product [Pleuronectes platessa]|uniref:Uncharacterized protein n=1 Tax=Pleuronectes platessa TaxID=8262 RepID=A0A9N7ZA58_PLEPL|nr:unnamed protein product [Pleuronectes platessa]